MIFLISLAILPFLIHPDPAAGLTRSKTRSRDLDCSFLSAEAGNSQRPGQVPVSPPRGDYIERSAMLCTERLMPAGRRAPRDEAVLSDLEGITAELASAAAGRRPDLAGRTWLVESFYPSVPVAAKLSFATRSALMRQGLSVSERTPRLGAGDVDVLTRLDPRDAYPAACLRYAATGALGAGEALLAVVSRDPRETILHGGLCVDGQWTWLL